MGTSRRHIGFSLVEVLLAVGTLSVGMIFIGGTYLVGVHLAGVSAERTTATIVANEAFAKVQLFFPNLRSPMNSQGRVGPIDPNELAYPSERSIYPSRNAVAGKQYFWSALCRTDPSDPSGRTSQITVFVNRKVGASVQYPFPIATSPGNSIAFPIAMPVEVTGVTDGDVLAIIDNPGTPFDEREWIGPGFTIVEDSSGKIFRVVANGDDPDQIRLDPDKPWPWAGNSIVWVVPPPVGRGRGPCIEVYQTEITFE